MHFFLNKLFVWNFFCWKFCFQKIIISSYRAGRYGRLDTLNSKIRPLFQILETAGKKSEEQEEEQQEEESITIE